MKEITIWCRGRFLWKVRLVSRPDNVATVCVRRDKLATITTECQTFQLLQQVSNNRRLVPLFVQLVYYTRVTPDQNGSPKSELLGTVEATQPSIPQR